MKPYFYSENLQSLVKKATTLAVVLLVAVGSFAGNGSGNSGNGNGNYTVKAPELIFRNGVLATGTAGADGAIYRFPNVATGLDALVKINGRSSSNVQLVDIDLSNTGFDKAFQPQVVYNGTTPSGTTDWWMEFGISFVQAGTNTTVTVTNFDVTALDIDGDGSKLQEYVSLYNQTNYTCESYTALSVSNVLENIVNVLTLDGKKFLGPLKQYAGIDTTATDVMATNSYKSSNQLRIRTGAQVNGRLNSTDGRMYSFWFKAFDFTTPIQNSLPVTLTSFEARLGDNKVMLNWDDASEFRFSHFIIERSVNGIEYTDAAMIFSNGSYHGKASYSYNDKVNTSSKGILYYRLKMVDINGAYVYSAVRIIRISTQEQNLSVVAYPNPVVNDLRVTVPANWQDKQVVLDLYNINGQVVKHVVTGNASQTEVMNVTDMPAGMYVLKASNGTEVATQKIIKK